MAFNSYASIFYNSKFFSPHKTLSYCSLMLKIKLKLIAEVKCIRQKLYSNFAFGTVVFCWYVRFLVGTCGFRDFNTIVLILCPFITTQDCQHKQFSMHISFLIFCSPTLYLLLLLRVFIFFCDLTLFRGIQDRSMFHRFPPEFARSKKYMF